MGNGQRDREMDVRNLMGVNAVSVESQIMNHDVHVHTYYILPASLSWAELN